MIPIARIEKFCNAPPPNVFKKPNTFCWFMKSMASLFVYGTGINVPIRKITSINNVKIILLLISLIFQKLAIVRNIKSPQLFRLLPQLPLSLQRKIYELLQLIFYQLYHCLKLSHLLWLFSQFYSLVMFLVLSQCLHQIDLICLS